MRLLFYLADDVTIGTQVNTETITIMATYTASDSEDASSYSDISDGFYIRSDSDEDADNNVLSDHADYSVNLPF